MWSDNSHAHTFPHAQVFAHSPGLDRLCLHSRLGCVLASGLRESSRNKAGHSAALQDNSSVPTSTQVSAEAAIFVAVIVVFYAAIIVILLGTNMRRPQSSSSSSRSRRSSRRSRSRSRPRHQVVLDPRDGSVSTQQAQKNKRDHSASSSSATVPGAHNV